MERIRNLLPIYLAATLGVIVTGKPAQYATYLAAAHLPLPHRRPVLLLEGAILALGILVLLQGRKLNRPTGLTLAWIGAGLSWTLLIISTPFTTAWSHFLSAIANLGVLVALVVYLLRHRSHPLHSGLNAIEGLTTTVMALAFVLLVGETVFAAVPASHAVGYTLASKLWYERYWTLRNPAGYRDVDRRGQRGRPVFMIGDSFVAGVGIANVEDRMSNLMDRELAPEYRVHNLGGLGSDTRDEYRRLLEQPEPPAVLILVYYTNDIEKACHDAGFRMPTWTPYSDLPGAGRAIVQRSYLLDFLYWRLPHGDLVPFESGLESCYANPAALSLHLADLKRFVTFANEHRVPLLVVAFPHLVNTEASRRLIEPVMRFFRDQRIPLLDVSPMVERLKPRDRIVNQNDAHPSVLLNHLVADSLLVMLRTLPLVAARR
jgi:FtsH-binding integral membrane protein